VLREKAGVKLPGAHPVPFHDGTYRLPGSR
jgi:hypothetical protein